MKHKPRLKHSLSFLFKTNMVKRIANVVIRRSMMGTTIAATLVDDVPSTSNKKGRKVKYHARFSFITVDTILNR